MIATMTRPSVALLSLMLCVAAGAASAQQPIPNRTTANYDDWIVRCEMGRDGAKDTKVCESVQAVVGPDGRIIAQAVIGRPAGAAGDKILVELPAGVWLPDGATIRVGDKPVVSLAFRRCLQSCYADADLSKQSLDALATATQPISLGFSDGPGKAMTLPLSAKGLRNAYAASVGKQGG
ncbi:invasion associated locus B family protein [Azospirillum brasilense]|uniref:invasion associated locus B family protein n=1 Tax=Azospirillum argentinense TaxID=2970906 RepID=UPI00190E7CAE|nr:invasion associated locus B family protein [Azospirillum argentinense]MBK3803451.1 invasion associated locus B family protein [Azospirillum argentinense]